ncbi:MAG: UDP-N-acetylmuramoyl-L-alanyl-D-glutamate--2,6-diaminopimelate ligase [Pseudomonadota bacterium]
MPTVLLKSPQAAARWLKEWVTGTLRTDSRQVRPGDGFIAWPGYATDGRQYVASALQAGATTCLVEREGVQAFGFQDARVASLPSLKAATGPIAHEFFGKPTDRLQVIATTGTNGKTSTAWWTAQANTLLGRRCGVVGTLGVGEPGAVQFTGLTTPDPVLLQAAFRRFVDQGFKACAIEASSIGIVEHRLAGTRIEVALFTNFTQDHLDYHGTMEAYWAAKRMLFGWPGLKAAVINIDDDRGAQLALELQGSSLDVWTYSVKRNARLCAQDLRYVDGGLAFTLREGEQTASVRSTLIGDYNASNLLAVLGGLRACGASLQEAAGVVPQLVPVPGRMQRVMSAPVPRSSAAHPPGGSGAAGAGPARGPVTGRTGLPEVVVDYAHTPDALEKVLQALRPLAAERGGRLVCVFGCGGNRDPGKRPLMGAIAEKLADRVVATSDNPRHEAPAQILQQVVAGLQRPADALVIEDRREAIARAVGQADARDVLLIAGKGHEDYQEIAGVKHPFSDVEEAAKALSARERKSG